MTGKNAKVEIGANGMSLSYKNREGRLRALLSDLISRSRDCF